MADVLEPIEINDDVDIDISNDILDMEELLSPDPFERVNENEILEIVSNWAKVNKETLPRSAVESLREDTGIVEVKVANMLGDKEEVPNLSDDDELAEVPSNVTFVKHNMIEVAIEPFEDNSSSLDCIEDENTDVNSSIQLSSLSFDGVSASPSESTVKPAAAIRKKSPMKIFTFGKLIKKTPKGAALTKGVAQQQLQVSNVPKHSGSQQVESSIKTKSNATTSIVRKPVASASIEGKIKSNISQATASNTFCTSSAKATAQDTSAEPRKSRNTTKQQTAKHVERLAMKKPSQVPNSIYQRSNTFTIDSAQSKKEHQKKKEESLNALATARRSALKCMPRKL